MGHISGHQLLLGARNRALLGIAGLFRNWRLLTATFLLLSSNVAMLPEAVADDLNVRDYGAVGDGHTDDGPAIQRTIDAAIRGHGPSQIVIPKGRYLLGPDFAHGSAQLVIDRAHGLSINGMPGAQLVSAAPQRFIFAIAASSEIRIGGLTLDRSPVLFGQGLIKSVDRADKTVLMSTNSVADALDSSLLAASKLLLVFSDPEAGSWGDHSAACAFYKPDDPSVCWPPMITARLRVGPNLWQLKLNTPPQADYVGRPAVVWLGPYKGRAFLISQSNDVTIHDLTYFAEGDEGAFIISHSGGTVKFDHFTMGVPAGSSQLVGSVGGAMVFNNHVHLVLDHVDMSRSWDDSLNMGANFARVYAQLSPTVLKVDGTRADFMIGDRLSVWDWIRKSVVSHVRIIDMSCLKKPDATCQLTLDHPVMIRHSGYAPSRSRNNDTDGIDRVIDLDGVGTLTVTDSSFQSLHARCLLIKASHSIIERSLCHDTVMAGIIIGPSFFWDEGPEANDITIRGNVFKNVSGANIFIQNGGSPAGPAVAGIKIIDNQFLDFGQFRHGVEGEPGIPITLQNALVPGLSGNAVATHFVTAGGPLVKTVDGNVETK